MNPVQQNIDRIGKTAAPLIPHQAAGDKPLVFVLTLMAFFAGLIFLITSMSLRATDTWRTRLDTQVTVQLYLPIPISDSEGRTEAISASADLIKNFSGVLSVDPLSDTLARKRLEPWLGSVKLPEDLPLPAIISVETAGPNALNVNALKDALANAGLDAEINTHSNWQESIKANARSLSRAMIFLFLCIFLGGIATSILATHSQIGTHKKIIAVLLQIGAKNMYIARLFTTRFLIKGLIAGVSGCILSLMFVVLFQVMSVFSDESLFRSFELTLSDIIYLACIACLFGLICAVAACLTSLTLLRSEQRIR